MDVLHNAEDMVLDVISNAEDAVIDAVSSAEDKILDAVSNAEDKILDAVSNAEEMILEVTGAQTIWPAAACLLAFFSCILFTWRVWSFTVRPWLHPDEPKELPYWFPCHAMSFFDDSDGLISYGRAFLDDDAPFAISFPGQTYNVVLRPQDVAAIYERTIILSWDYYLKELLLSFGVDKAVLVNNRRKTSTYQNGGAEQSNGVKSNGVKPDHKSIVHWTEDLYRQQFPPGSRFDALSDNILGLIEESLRWAKLPSRYTVNEESVPLMEFCANVLVDATTRSLLGDSIYGLEPRFTPMMVDFTEESWKLLMLPYPKVAAPKLHTAKNAIHNALCKYVKSPPEPRATATWMMQEVMEAPEAADISDTDKASIIHAFLYIANINAYRLSFWILSYILFDKNLLAAIREEIVPTFRGSSVHSSHILERCPRLLAVFNETLRMTYGSVSVRRVMAPTKIGGKSLRPNTSVMIPIRQLHYDDEAFGGDAEVFDPDRFLNNDLDRSPSFLPFGERYNSFPRPFLAKREVLAFVALVLHRYEIDVVANSSEPKAEPSLPRIDQVCQTMGIMQPVKGTEVYVRLKEAA